MSSKKMIDRDVEVNVFRHDLCGKISIEIRYRLQKGIVESALWLVDLNKQTVAEYYDGEILANSDDFFSNEILPYEGRPALSHLKSYLHHHTGYDEKAADEIYDEVMDQMNTYFENQPIVEKMNDAEKKKKKAGALRDSFIGIALKIFLAGVLLWVISGVIDAYANNCASNEITQIYSMTEYLYSTDMEIINANSIFPNVPKDNPEIAAQMTKHNEAIKELQKDLDLIAENINLEIARLKGTQNYEDYLQKKELLMSKIHTPIKEVWFWAIVLAIVLAVFFGRRMKKHRLLQVSYLDQMKG